MAASFLSPLPPPPFFSREVSWGHTHLDVGDGLRTWDNCKHDCPCPGPVLSLHGLCLCLKFQECLSYLASWLVNPVRWPKPQSGGQALPILLTSAITCLALGWLLTLGLHPAHVSVENWSILETQMWSGRKWHSCLAGAVMTRR